jgi:hypothetical protein
MVYTLSPPSLHPERTHAPVHNQSLTSYSICATVSVEVAISLPSISQPSASNTSSGRIYAPYCFPLLAATHSNRPLTSLCTRAHASRSSICRTAVPPVPAQGCFWRSVTESCADPPPSPAAVEVTEARVCQPRQSNQSPVASDHVADFHPGQQTWHVHAQAKGASLLCNTMKPKSHAYG